MGETGELELSAGEFEVFCWYLLLSVLLLGFILRGTCMNLVGLDLITGRCRVSSVRHYDSTSSQTETKSQMRCSNKDQKLTMKKRDTAARKKRPDAMPTTTDTTSKPVTDMIR